ncbi:Arb2 domain-containing protein [Exophiala viscosa]|uniref:Arb2 domain-containing protein n=1 Tax=Exophiala viscosa TaxID=2486360 RepID=A0AAN6E563_9EURO|nr:Arb2 domain-containing protein [Exophiala viscosa]
MFRRLPHTLPPDPVFEPALDKLGFFVNEADQIRSIKNPEQKYQYAVNKNERVNEVYKQANNTAIRKIVQDRLSGLDIETVRLPLGVSEDQNHLPILVSKDISSRDRVILFFGGRHLEPAILSWRVIGEEGIKVGSLLEFVNAALSGPPPTPEHSMPGIVVANPCQLLWYRGGARAVSENEWLNLPRVSAVHEPFRIDPVKNRIPENGTYEEHVKYVFEHVLPKLVKENAKIDIIALEYLGSAVIDYLASDWSVWASRVTGMSLISPQHKVQDLIEDGAPPEFVEFLSKRSRAYFVSPEKVETPITGRSRFGCNCYASGEHLYQESAVIRSWGSILDWFSRLYADPSFEEVPFVEVDDGDDAEQVKLGW